MRSPPLFRQSRNYAGRLLPNTHDMPMDFLRFLQALTDSGAEFVIVGGVAARLYGSTRLTHDVDVVPKLDADSWAALVDEIWVLGGRPRIPEKQESIKNLGNVQGWIADKGMLALTFRSTDGSAEIDLLVSESKRFEKLKQNATRVKLDNREYLVASIPDLIEMKRRANRPQDLLDIEQLEAIQQQSEKIGSA